VYTIIKEWRSYILPLLHICFVFYLLAALPLDTRPCILRFALGPGFIYRKVTMLTWAMLTPRSCCLLQRLPAGRRSLGSELAGIAPAALWTCRHAPGCLVVSARCCCRVPRLKRLPLSCCRRPTVNICSPDTRPSPKTAVAYACPSAGWLRGMYAGRGQTSSTSSDDGAA